MSLFVVMIGYGTVSATKLSLSIFIKSCFAYLKLFIALLTVTGYQCGLKGFVETSSGAIFLRAIIAIAFMYCLITNLASNYGHNKILLVKDVWQVLTSGAGPLPVTGFSERLIMPSLSLSNYTLKGRFSQ